MRQKHSGFVLIPLTQVFGYRGVILFPWLARVYDRDIPHKKDNRCEKSEFACLLAGL
jgi:hypothetical protein